MKKIEFIKLDNRYIGAYAYNKLFENARSWENIPMLSVITGQNGKGKSTLLQYIDNIITDEFSSIEQKYSRSEVLHVTSMDSFFYTSHPKNRDVNYSIKYERQVIIKQVNDCISAHYSVMPTNSFAHKVAMECKRRIDINKEKLSDQYIQDVANSIIEYDLNEIKISDPVGFIGYILACYEERVNFVKSEIKQIPGALSLFDYYLAKSSEEKNELNINNNLDIREFLNLLAQNIDMEMFIESYLKSTVGQSPLDEINSILEKYNFKYKAAHKKIKNTNDKKIVFEQGDIEIDPDSLSSGEKLIFTLLTWQFYIKGLVLDENDQIPKIDNKIKIILLDEFDRHFDPKLCYLFLDIIKQEFVEKSKIQVIMTTHRLDTVALAPKESIFVMENANNQLEIINCHPLQGIFRMTSNVRSLVDYHSKVYTESTNDACFYQGVYSSLKKYCSLIRDKIKLNYNHKPEYQWKLNSQEREEISLRLLSQRYEMRFYSVNSSEDGGGGSCATLKHKVKSDDVALKKVSSILSKRLFPDPKLHYSYGILDKDFRKEPKLDKDSLQERIKLLPRHSLENFIFDPIIFCSVLSDEDIEKLFTIDLKTTLGNIKKYLIVKNYIELQKEVESYFQMMFNDMSESYRCQTFKKDDVSKTIVDRIMNKISKIGKEYKLCDEEIKIIISETDTILVKYPSEFLEVRGHDIETHFVNKHRNVKEKASTHIVEYIENNGLEYIPLDLAEVFFTLNEWIRTNFRSVIKPQQDTIETIGNNTTRDNITNPDSSRFEVPISGDTDQTTDFL